MQVLVGFDSGGMVAIFPERTLRTPPLVVLLRGAPCDELDALSDYVWPCVFDQKVYMVGRDHVIEHAQTEAFLRLEHPMQIAASVRVNLNKNFL